MTRVSRLAVIVPLLLALAACTDKGEDVQTKPQADAKAQVEQLATAARTAAGIASFSQSNANISGCDGRAGEISDPDEVYYVQGIYQLLVPAEQQAAAIAKVRDAWKQAGHTIKTERTFDSGGGEIIAVTTDEYDLSLGTGEPPAMSLLVSSPCYRNAS
ncbi:hypothetical protein GCM10010435_70280 [Winogradskya consettensis]|uniref:Lipoprotein n=1 Tax=Winogradskya consettensis TaxID=113560 RepID=A0A919SR44_9ACTN|nr:hypothetical protein [Actinoplanes consettensis]GIM75533.1 hypothetical protein Aco04nite_45830 [Actinoplanes consettensis]